MTTEAEERESPEDGLFHDKVGLTSAADLFTSVDDGFHHEVDRLLTVLRSAKIIRGLHDAPSLPPRPSRIDRQDFESRKDLVTCLSRFRGPIKNF